MSFFKLLTEIASKNMASKDTVKPVHNAVPLLLHQGSVVNLPELDITLAQADGSCFPNIEPNQTIVAVGEFQVFQVSVYHAYLSDGKSFLRVVGDNVQELALFTTRDEIMPRTTEDWEFWLGKYQKDDAGQWVKDSYGQAILAEAGLIGWPQFEISKGLNAPESIVFERAWNPGTNGIEPVSFKEVLTDNEGKRIYVKHECMEYSRALNENTRDILLASLAQSGDDASVNIFVGIPLNPAHLKVLAV